MNISNEILEQEKNQENFEELIMENMQGLNNEINIEQEQNNFLSKSLGQVVNTAIDFGIRWALPDMIENEVIEIKNTIFESGLKEGIEKAIKDTIDTGKGVIGIVTGKFDNVSQVQRVVERGGLLDSVSDVIDKSLSVAKKKGAIDSNVFNLIKNSKNTIIKNISANVEDVLEQQLKGVNNLTSYIDNWNKFYNNRDFDNMEKEYKKISTQLKKIIPLEKTINQARNIENIHTLIKNKGGDFNLSKEELDLIKKL